MSTKPTDAHLAQRVKELETALYKSKERIETLRQSERKFRFLAERVSDIIWTLDLNLKTTYVSPSIREVLGFTPIERMHQDASELMTPKSYASAVDTLTRELEAEKKGGVDPKRSLKIEIEYYHKDGGTVWTENAVRWMRDSAGDIVGIHGVSRDITDRRRAEAALRESENRLRAIFRANANPIVVYDTKGHPQYLNPAFTEIFGWTLDELKGRRIPFVPEDERERTTAKIEEIYASGAPVRFSTRRLTRKGQTLEVIVSAALVKGPEGKATGLVSNLTDISEQRRLESQLRQSQKMESIGRLAGGVAHDYNNMLSVILGFAEIAMEKVTPEDPLCADLEEILSAAKRSSDITRQLLAFSRRQTVSPKVLDLNESVEATLKMLRRLIGEDIDLLWKPAGELWPVKIDPAQLDQVMANLCINARDAISGVGKITIETGTAAFDKSHCAENPEFLPGDFSFLVVIDDGCGMDREIRENLFEPFFTTKEVNQGTGLGLSTVYGIVRQNNGFINVYSEPGHGATFKIYLPRYTGRTRSEAKQKTEKVLEKSGETLMVVEDERAMLKLTRRMLEKMGYRVLSASSPQEALERAESHPGEIDLLLTDVVMPEMSGRDLSDRLRSLRPEVKTLYMSGYAANVIAKRGMIDAETRFINKPFSSSELWQKIQEVLKNQQP